MERLLAMPSILATLDSREDQALNEDSPVIKKQKIRKSVQDEQQDHEVRSILDDHQRLRQRLELDIEQQLDGQQAAIALRLQRRRQRTLGPGQLGKSQSTPAMLQQEQGQPVQPGQLDTLLRHIISE
jgi:hypothetical protein